MNGKEILKTNGINPTMQRIKLLEYMMSSRQHPTADTVYEDMKKEMPVISRQTVYNTLKEFVDKGLIIEIDTPKAVRYDYIFKKHGHFYCKECHKIYDLDQEISVSFDKEKINHRVEGVQVYLTGICEECLKNKRR